MTAGHDISRAPTDIIIRTHDMAEPPREHGSGGYRQDKDTLLKWMLGLIAVALVCAVIKHEIALSNLDFKLDLLIKHFGIGEKK
jgi:hypothetical protein